MAMSLSHCRLCGKFAKYFCSASAQYARKSIQVSRPSSLRQFSSSSIVFSKDEDPSNKGSTDSQAEMRTQTEGVREESSDTTLQSKGSDAAENVRKGRNTKPRKGKDKKQTAASSDSDEIYAKMESAARNVASTLKERGQETQTDLLEQLRKHKMKQEQGENGTPDQDDGKDMEHRFSFMISEMKADLPIKESRKNLERKLQRGKFDFMPPGDRTSGKQDKSQFPARRPTSDFRRLESFAKHTLFTGKGLNIFEKGKDYPIKEKDDNSLWARLEREEYEDMQFQYIPQNTFDEMIKMTRENKLWTFPVENEQGMEEEQDVPFYDHIFLEELIKDFPQKGPVRNFMNLVVVGLSKNPNISVQEKREHIDWFRKYFKERQDILQEALGEDGVFQAIEAAKKSPESEV